MIPSIERRQTTSAKRRAFWCVAPNLDQTGFKAGGSAGFFSEFRTSPRQPGIGTKRTGETPDVATNRAILDSDIIHVRQLDGRDIDGILHGNPRLKTKGWAMTYNLITKKADKLLRLPLYYTGLKNKAVFREKDGPPRIFSLHRQL